MIDTHAHIFLPEFDEDRDEMMARAAAAGVKAIIMPAIDFSSLTRMEALESREPLLYMAAGIHPCDVEKADLAELEGDLFRYCTRDDIIAVGETGLDYHWSTEFVKEQKESLRIHLETAKDVEKPVILHNRKSTADLLDMVEEAQDGSLTGVWHCFNGTLDEGKRAVDLGLYLGIGGVLTFKNSGVDKTAARLPLEKMVLETDAPYLAPAPNRGKRNEPACIKYTAEKLAGIFELSLDEITRITTQNAETLFRLI